MCQSRCENRTIYKYTDDTVIVSLLQDSEQRAAFVKSYLHLNIFKAKQHNTVIVNTWCHIYQRSENYMCTILYCAY